MSTPTRSEERISSAPRARVQKAWELKPTSGGFRITPPNFNARQLVGPALRASKAQASAIDGVNRVRFPAGGSK